MVAPGVAHATTYTESFERDFGGWQPRSDGIPPKWSVTRSTDLPFDGQWGLRYDIDGSRDDGTVWVQRRFPVPPGARTVEIRYWMWSEMEAIAGNWKIMGFAGARDPKTEFDFTKIGDTNLWRGWRQLSYSWRLPNDVTNYVVVALGLSVIWEVNRTDYFDLITVSIT
jgi:hypothetical protein